MPADRTRISGRFATIWRNNPSAIGLRQTFPVQTNKIFLSGLKARKGAMFAEAVQGHVRGVVSAGRGQTRDALPARVAWSRDALPRVRRRTSIEHAKVKLGETNGEGLQLESA